MGRSSSLLFLLKNQQWIFLSFIKLELMKTLAILINIKIHQKGIILKSSKTEDLWVSTIIQEVTLLSYSVPLTAQQIRYYHLQIKDEAKAQINTHS